MTLSARRNRERVPQFERLRETLERMEQATLTEVAWAYPDEMLLYFRPKNTSSDTGQWGLSTRASRWMLLSPTAVEARDSDNRGTARDAFQSLIGRGIDSVVARFEDYSLCVNLSGGYRFVILTNKPRHVRDISYWILLTPTGDALHVHQNGHIHFIPKGMTMEEQEAHGYWPW